MIAAQPLVSASGKIFSPSVGRNKEVLLQHLLPKLLHLAKGEAMGLIEVAGGSGEHAAMLAAHMKGLCILPVEPDANMTASIAAWSVEDGAADAIKALGSCVLPAVNIGVEDIQANTWAEETTRRVTNDVNDVPSPTALPATCKAILCVNMIHISPYFCTEQLFRAGKEVLPVGGQIFTYGPYAESGGVMVDSNAAFDVSLKERNPEWGVRDIESVARTAREHGGFVLSDRLAMPANNLLLTFTRQ